MKKLLTISLIMATTFTVNAQSLNGTQDFSGNPRDGSMLYTLVNWRVNYQIYQENGMFYISLSNATVSVANNSLFGNPTKYYSKADLGLSSWPDSEPTPYNFQLNLTIKLPDGSNASQSANLDGGSYIENSGKFKNTSASSFKVISVQSMYYNGGRDGVVERLIESKRNNSNNNTQSSTNASGQTSTSNAGTTTPVQIPDDYKGNPMTYNTNGGSNTNTTTNTYGTKPLDNYDPKTGLYTNRLTVNSSSSATTQNSPSSNTTTTNPLDNYDPNTGLYSNPLAIYNSAASDFQKNYETGQQIGTAIVGIIDLFSPSPEELQRREREENLRIEREEKAARVRAEKARNITLRKDLIKKYPDGKTPLSYEAKNSSEVYFFVYSYKESTLENDNPTIYISNVFALQKYADGTWPFKTSLMQKIAKENKDLEFILSGFYESKTEAVQQHQYFASGANSSAFAINGISFEIKKTSETSDSQTDFWGNPNKNVAPKPTTNNNNAKTDFWGNPIKSLSNEQNIPAEKKQDSTKTATKVDFWGNPIKD